MLPKKRIIKAVLFDFWGTLVFHRDHKQLVRLGDAPKSRDEKLVNDLEKIVMRHRLSSTQLAAALKQKLHLSNQVMEEVKPFLTMDDVELYPDVRDTLQQLQKQKIKIGLVSNTQSAGMKKTLKRLGIDSFFSGYGLSFDVGVLKPDSRIFWHALKQMKVKPNNALMVGDSLDTDILGGKAAGLYTCLIDRTNQRVTPKECDFKVKRLMDLIKWVKRK